MADMLFVRALVVPPLVVVLAFATLALPVRRETQSHGHLRAHAH